MSDSLSPLSPLSLSLFLSIQSSFVFLCSSYLSVLIAFCSVHLSLRFASHTTYVRWHMPPIFTKLFGQLCTQFSANRTMPAPHWVQTDSVPGQDRQPEIAHASAWDCHDEKASVQWWSQEFTEEEKLVVFKTRLTCTTPPHEATHDIATVTILTRLILRKERKKSNQARQDPCLELPAYANMLCHTGTWNSLETSRYRLGGMRSEDTAAAPKIQGDKKQDFHMC